MQVLYVMLTAICGTPGHNNARFHNCDLQYVSVHYFEGINDRDFGPSFCARVIGISRNMTRP